METVSPLVIWDWAVILTFFVVVLGIGVYFFVKTKGGGEKDYFLGGRSMSGWVAAL